MIDMCGGHSRTLVVIRHRSSREIISTTQVVTYFDKTTFGSGALEKDTCAAVRNSLNRELKPFPRETTFGSTVTHPECLIYRELRG